MSGPVYHLQSLALAMVVVSATTLLCLAPALLRYGEEFRESLRSWILGTALVVASDAVFFLEFDLPSLSAVLIATAGLGVAEWIHALRLFDGRSSRLRWPYGLVVVATSASLAAPPIYPAHVVITSLLFAALYFGAALTAGRIARPLRSIGRTLLVTVFGVIGLVMVGRLGLMVSGLRSGAPEGFTTGARAMLFLCASIGPVVGSLAFVLACGERLGDRILRWSLTDPLTGLPNRRAFLHALTKALASSHRHREPVALLAIDIDHFKRVNDTAGHRAGDHVLVEVARRLLGASRSEDTVGRLGGDEFVVVVPGSDREAAIRVAERMRRTVAQTPVADGESGFELTISVGVAVTDETTATEPELLERADAHLYEAKNRGRDRVVVQSDLPPEA